MTQIADHGHDDPIPFELSQSERDLAAHMQAQLRFRLVAENARQNAREMREQADRDYLTHNRSLDGQS